MHRPDRRDSGQAGVETSLTMPLVVFMFLGTLQLFMILQARILAQYAVYKAVRAGSVTHGRCDVMVHTAIASLLPSITRSDSPLAVANGFFRLRNNRYSDGDPPHRGQVVEIFRERPLAALILSPPAEDNRFDQPPTLERLDVRMIYWYRMKIPFADWVISRMFRAHLGIQAYTAVNPLMPAQRNANWGGGSSMGTETWPGGGLASNMNTWANGGAYVFPIRVTASMRMMTPPHRTEFMSQECRL